MSDAPSTAPARGTIGRTLDRVLVVGWLALTLAGVYAFGAELAFHLSSPSPTTLWENGPLQVAMNVARGQPMYPDWTTGPVQLAIYGPLYHGTLASIATMTSCGPLTLAGYARLLGVVSIGIALLAAARFVRSAGAPIASAFLALSCVFLFTRTGIRFLASARPDALAAAFSVLALGFAFGSGPWSAVVTALLLTAALQTKMTAGAAAVAIAIALLRTGQFRRLAVIGGATVALNALVLACLQYATSGWFWHHVMIPSAAPMRARYAWFMLSGRSGVVEAVCLAVVPLVALVTAPRRAFAPATGGPDARELAGAAYFVTAWLVALASATHQGSDQNYLIEPALAAGMVFGLWSARVAPISSPRRYAVTRAAAGLALVAFAVLFLPGRSGRFDDVAFEARRAANPYGRPSDEWIRSLPQPLLATSPWLAYRADVANDLNDPIPYVCMLGDSADDTVARRVAARRYGAIVVSLTADDAGFVYDDIPRLWPGLRQAIQANYLPYARYGSWTAYVPR